MAGEAAERGNLTARATGTARQRFPRNVTDVPSRGVTLHYVAPGMTCQERFPSCWDDLQPHELVHA